MPQVVSKRTGAVSIIRKLVSAGMSEHVRVNSKRELIGEFPDEKAAASAILAAAAGGSLSDIETTVAMSAKDAHATFEAAGKAAKEFRSAGRS